MFYSEGVLARKGPLARVWLAAHWDRRLTKAQFLQTNIQDCVVAIIGGDQPPMALRLTGQLLLGVVKIYSRKTRYLMEDCNEAVFKIKTTSRPSDVDLREDQVTANFNAITLPDALNELDVLQPDLDITLRPWDAVLHPAVSQNVSRPQDITLRESSVLLSSVGGTIDNAAIFNLDFDVLGTEDGKGVNFDLGLDFDMPGGTTPQQRDQGDQTSPMEVEVGRDAVQEQSFAPDFGVGPRTADNTFEDIAADGGENPLMPMDDHEPPAFENVEVELGITRDTYENEASVLSRESLLLKDQPSPLTNQDGNIMFEVPDIVLDEVLSEEVVETSSAKKLVPKKRRLVIDEKTQLSDAVMKRHLIDTSDITGKLTFLPFSRRNLQLATLTADDYLDFRPHALAEELRSLFGPPPTENFRAGKTLRRDLHGDEGEEKAVVPISPKAESVQPTEAAVHREAPMPEDYAGIGEHFDTGDFSYAADSVDDSAFVQTFAPVEEHLIADQVESALHSPVPCEAPSASFTPAAPEGRGKLSFYDSSDLSDEFRGDHSLQQLESGAGRRVFSKTALKTMGFLRTQFAAAAGANPADPQPELSFMALSSSARRGDAARLFYEVLLLTTKNVIGVSQEEAYGDITLRAKDELFVPKSSSSEVAVR